MPDQKKNDDRALGAVLVAGLFGLVFSGALFVTGYFGLISSVAVFVGVFLLLFLVLWLGWRKPLPGPMGPGHAPTAGGAGAGAGSAPKAGSGGGAGGADAGTTASATTGGAAATAASTTAPDASTAGGSGVAPASGAQANPGPAEEPAPEAQAAPEAAPAAAPQPETAVEPSAGSRPVALEGPREGQGDDLKQIKGVGPKLEELCHSLGFYHFDQIAAWTPDEVAWDDQNLEGFKGRVTRDDWVAQARTLASGGSTEFSEKVEKGDVY